MSTPTPDLGPTRTVHPRYFVTTQAQIDAAVFFLDLLEERELTYAEAFSVIAHLTTRLAGMAVRDERREEGETT